MESFFHLLNRLETSEFILFIQDIHLHAKGNNNSVPFSSTQISINPY